MKSVVPVAGALILAFLIDRYVIRYVVRSIGKRLSCVSKEAKKTMLFFFVAAALGFFAAFMMAGCAINPVVQSDGVRAYPYTSVSPTQHNTAPLPCKGALTSVVVEHNNIGWGGWNESVMNTLGTGLMRRQCVWVKQAQKPSEIRYSLVVSVFQPGDQVVVNLALVDVPSGAVAASRTVSHNHEYDRDQYYNGRIGGIYTPQRDQYVFYSLSLALGAAIDGL